MAAAGIEPGDVVAIAAERNEQAFALRLACLIDGVLPFFVDPRHETDVLMKLLDAVRIHGLYCGESLDKKSFQSRLPYLKWTGEKGAPKSTSVRATDEQAESSAFILHSAGTCGLPRAIYHSANAIRWQANSLTFALRLKPGALLWFTGTLASAAVQAAGLFAALSGGTLVLDDPAESLATASRDSAQSVLLLAESQDGTMWNAENWLSVKGNLTAVLVTDAVVSEEYATLISKATDAAVWTGYYAADTAGFVALNTVPGVWPYASAGRPIGGAEFAVLDSENRHVSSDLIGRLFIRDCPRPTQVVSLTFRSGNKAELPDGVLTGDWAWLDDQDFLFCEGCERAVFEKAGFQVRVVPIEERLRDVDGVRDAIVFAIPTEELENEIAAALLPAGSPPEAFEVQQALADFLPRFLIPSKFSIINKILTTPTGKRVRFGHEAAMRGAEKAAPVPSTVTGPIVADSPELTPTENGGSIDKTE
ncbi:MAG: AMP-binding protein [bacterium]|nr:AMP-binding protein [bacterium]